MILWTAAMNSMSVKGEKKNLMVYLVMSYHVITSVSLALTSLIKYNLSIPSMAFIYCKKCGEYRYLTPHAFWNVNDLNVKCKDCGTINIITIENGELRKQV
jgi:hypothetical protein